MSLPAAPGDGQTGTVTTTPPVSSEQVPTNPGSIKATTSKEDVIQVLKRNWIYKATYRVTAAMKPGQVIGYFKIHPNECNPYVAHVARMFLTWTGTMKVRTRFMANFANGGSFRVGFLPPYFTEEQVQNMSLATRTAYPNMDLDPKFTDWTEFSGVDERRVLFHTMDESTPEGFGGWIVFYVVGSLVQSLQTSGEVSMIIETAGDFEFLQLADLSDGGVTPTTSGPLPPQACLNILDQLGCDDHIGGDGLALQVQPVGNINAKGFFLATSLDGSAPEALASGSIIDHKENVGSYRQRAQGTILVDGSGTDKYKRDTKGGADGFFKSYLPAGYLAIVNCENGALIVQTFTQGLRKAITDVIIDNDGVWFGHPGYHEDLPSDHSRTRIDQDYSFKSTEKFHFHVDPAILLTHSLLRNQRPNESIVQFANLNLRTLNLQTKAISGALKSQPPGITADHLYTVRAPNVNGPIMYLRLQPCGMFTTHASTTWATVRNRSAYLSYEGIISPDAAIPNPPVTAKNLLYEQFITRKMAKHNISYADVCARYALAYSQ